MILEYGKKVKDMVSGKTREESVLKSIFTDEKGSLPQWITLLYEKVDGIEWYILGIRIL